MSVTPALGTLWWYLSTKWSNEYRVKAKVEGQQNCASYNITRSNMKHDSKTRGFASGQHPNQMFIRTTGTIYTDPSEVNWILPEFISSHLQDKNWNEINMKQRHDFVVETIQATDILCCCFPMSLTARDSRSTLLPRTTNGKLSGSRGLDWIRNSSLQLSRFLNVFGIVTSYTSTQQSAPR